jgi:hypothetical protein
MVRYRISVLRRKRLRADHPGPSSLWLIVLLTLRTTDYNKGNLA